MTAVCVLLSVRTATKNRLMPKFIDKLSTKAGLPPGTMVPVGKPKTDKPRVTAFEYAADTFQEKEIKSLEEISISNKQAVTWVNIDGLDVDLVDKIGSIFGIHPLVLEDIVNTAQRPKTEDFGDYIFVTLKMLALDNAGDITSEQVSLIIGAHYVISFQEKVGGDVFDGVRNRIRKEKSRTRRQGPDYLAYALIDTIVDHYFVVLEKLDEKIERLEEALLKDVNCDFNRRFHELRRDVIFLLKQVWPLREVVSSLQRSESNLVKSTTGIFLRDLHDHAVVIVENVETLRDFLSGLHDIYLSSISNRMNEIMKVLTIITTIFIPLSFIAGIYGMNFKHMPELESSYGYPAVLIFMGFVGFLMVLYFKKKKWI